MHATSSVGNGSQPLVVGPFQERQVCEQERIFWTARGFVTSQQCFQG
jgi:hypothetical protein